MNNLLTRLYPIWDDLPLSKDNLTFVLDSSTYALSLLWDKVTLTSFDDVLLLPHWSTWIFYSLWVILTAWTTWEVLCVVQKLAKILFFAIVKFMFIGIVFFTSYQIYTSQNYSNKLKNDFI